MLLSQSRTETNENNVGEELLRQPITELSGWGLTAVVLATNIFGISTKNTIGTVPPIEEERAAVKVPSCYARVVYISLSWTSYLLLQRSGLLGAADDVTVNCCFQHCSPLKYDSPEGVNSESLCVWARFEACDVSIGEFSRKAHGR